MIDHFEILFDTGSDVTLINWKALPQGAGPKALKMAKKINTVVGLGSPTHSVHLQGVRFPELSATCKIDKSI